MKRFRDWYDMATPEERAKLAKRARTSVRQLDHLAKGRRKASADLAGRIEKAFIPSIADIRRGDICEACRKCPYHPQ